MSPNHWYPAAFSHEVKRKQLIDVTFMGDSFAVYRGEDGVARSVENRCPHRQIKLSHGTVEGCNVVCIYHGWTFEPGGKLVGFKHDKFGKKLPVLNVQAYPVRERYGIIWFFPGDPELAALTPLVEIPHSDDWASVRFAFTWAAHHSMLIDNLCNLSHLWVHGSWVPYGPTVLADSSAEKDKLTLSWEHELRRDFMHPFTKRVFRRDASSNLSDTFMIYDYPYQSALSNQRIRSTNFMLPIDETHTRVFTYQLWKPPKGVPKAVFQRLVMPALKPIAREIFRQDGFTVEEEQKSWFIHGHRPIPEPNPMVKRFNELTVRKWDEYLEFKRTGTLTDAQMAEQVRVKVL
ncbi:MAG TPA: aromatic ring-hydroxylating dioxygenase subunit alpha [Polyangiaceae bacterium]|nr:aromatic ring-hydroxylating dioxygenase subunit alpha [Polyangiaceae bacterium]